ncbi:integral membrane protein [Mycobacterium lentiflavum]|uniref:Integral membrane protein n=2 Tax=Mycobacterium lentiflavum TaxID=141349 RepID=A0A0E4GVH9_MYCLN|nr:integral membrane protein [Mycobacterium lentiflavum]
MLAATAGAALVAAAVVLPSLGVRPRLDLGPERFATHAQAAPLFGAWELHASWGTGPAILLAIAAVTWGPVVAQRLSWRTLTLSTWAVACGWAFALAMIDGWQRGFAGRLTTRDEYVTQVPGITDIPATVRTFTTRILDYQPNSWITHVSGHPPGALLTFVWLDRLGLHGGAWAGLLCLLVGSSAAAAVVIAIRALADEQTARLAAPFVAIAPTAIWVAVSADGYFAGVAAWGIALLAVAVHRPVRFPALIAAAAGLLLGWCVFLSYGLALLGLAAAAVLVSAKDFRAALRALGPATLTALMVAVTFAVAGFYWFDGYTLVQQRYWQGIAHDRPFQYWWWANLACAVCAIGLGGVAGITRLFDGAAIRRRSGFHLVLLAMVAAIVCADLSMLSKAEVERIWLPFTIWLTAAPALLPVRSHRVWLAINAAGALLVNTVMVTHW